MGKKGKKGEKGKKDSQKKIEDTKKSTREIGGNLEVVRSYEKVDMLATLLLSGRMHESMYVTDQADVFVVTLKVYKAIIQRYMPRFGAFDYRHSPYLVLTSEIISPSGPECDQHVWSMVPFESAVRAKQYLNKEFGIDDKIATDMIKAEYSKGEQVLSSLATFDRQRCIMRNLLKTWDYSQHHRLLEQQIISNKERFWHHFYSGFLEEPGEISGPYKEKRDEFKQDFLAILSLYCLSLHFTSVEKENVRVVFEELLKGKDIGEPSPVLQARRLFETIPELMCEYFTQPSKSLRSLKLNPSKAAFYHFMRYLKRCGLQGEVSDHALMNELCIGILAYGKLYNQVTLAKEIVHEIKQHIEAKKAASISLEASLDSTCAPSDSKPPNPHDDHEEQSCVLQNRDQLKGIIDKRAHQRIDNLGLDLLQTAIATEFPKKSLLSGSHLKPLTKRELRTFTDTVSYKLSKVNKAKGLRVVDGENNLEQLRLLSESLHDIRNELKSLSQIMQIFIIAGLGEEEGLTIKDESDQWDQYCQKLEDDLVKRFKEKRQRLHSEVDTDPLFPLYHMIVKFIAEMPKFPQEMDADDLRNVRLGIPQLNLHSLQHELLSLLNELPHAHGECESASYGNVPDALVKLGQLIEQKQVRSTELLKLQALIPSWQTRWWELRKKQLLDHNSQIRQALSNFTRVVNKCQLMDSMTKDIWPVEAEMNRFDKLIKELKGYHDKTQGDHGRKLRDACCLSGRVDDLLEHWTDYIVDSKSFFEMCNQNDMLLSVIERHLFKAELVFCELLKKLSTNNFRQLKSISHELKVTIDDTEVDGRISQLPDSRESWRELSGCYLNSRDLIRNCIASDPTREVLENYFFKKLLLLEGTAKNLAGFISSIIMVADEKNLVVASMGLYGSQALVPHSAPVNDDTDIDLCLCLDPSMLNLLIGNLSRLDEYNCKIVDQNILKVDVIFEGKKYDVTIHTSPDVQPGFFRTIVLPIASNGEFVFHRRDLNAEKEVLCSPATLIDEEDTNSSISINRLEGYIFLIISTVFFRLILQQPKDKPFFIDEKSLDIPTGFLLNILLKCVNKKYPLMSNKEFIPYLCKGLHAFFPKTEYAIFHESVTNQYSKSIFNARARVMR